jgi:hypothetical protein
MYVEEKARSRKRKAKLVLETHREPGDFMVCPFAEN